MKKYIYTVWFRDNLSPVGDEDHEYPVCLVIEAENEEKAKEWCDELSQDFSKRNPANEVLNSKIEDIDSYKGSEISSAPFIKYGYKASDEEIGW